jgi:4-diphosphocytidyl-2-C-methyl-D-erythritol kinase
LAGELGSDCPLFLFGEHCILEGRGELAKPLPTSVAERFCGDRLLLFAPSLGMDTPEVYGRLALNPDWYSDHLGARTRLTAWLNGNDDVDALLVNDLQKPVFEKCPGLPALLGDLSEKFGWKCGMSGSGSCCFALLKHDLEITDGIDVIRSAWGKNCFVKETAFA